MLTTVRITKAQAVLLQTMKIADETMSVKEYVAGALAECTTDNLVVKKVKVGKSFDEGPLTAIPLNVLDRVPNAPLFLDSLTNRNARNGEAGFEAGPTLDLGKIGSGSGPTIVMF